MTDMEKVIKGLECHVEGNCVECPYRDGWRTCPFGETLLADTLALLKEQEAVVRCKDCVFWQDNNGGYPHVGCKWRKDETPDPDDFCSAGELRTDFM